MLRAACTCGRTMAGTLPPNLARRAPRTMLTRPSRRSYNMCAMGRFWLGSDEGRDWSADACYGNGRVWLGSDEGRDWGADARYGDGRVWLGSDEGRDWSADARYGDGRVWLGSDEGRDWSADARYAGSDGGAAAAAVILLLDASTAGSGAQDSEEQESEAPGPESSYSSESEGSASYSGTSAPSPGNSAGLGWLVGAVIITIIFFAGTQKEKSDPNIADQLTTGQILDGRPTKPGPSPAIEIGRASPPTSPDVDRKSTRLNSSHLGIS